MNSSLCVCHRRLSLTAITHGSPKTACENISKRSSHRAGGRQQASKLFVLQYFCFNSAPSTFKMLCFSTVLLQISPINLQTALFYCTFADLQQIWPAKVFIIRVRIAIFHVMWTGAAIWRRETACTTGSTLSSPYGRARPHHIEYCHPRP